MSRHRSHLEGTTLALADRMRRSACADPTSLRSQAREEVFPEAETSLFRHAAIHAGIIKPWSSLPYFTFCPECEMRLDWPDLDGEQDRKVS